MKDNSLSTYYQVITTVEDLCALREEWNELLTRCAYQSFYLRHEFFYHGVQAFKKPNAHLLIFMVRQVDDDRLIAIFPMQKSKLNQFHISLDLIEYAVTDEIDKPFPLLDQHCEKLAWAAFSQYFREVETAWDLMHFMEIHPDLLSSLHIQAEFPPPAYHLHLYADAKCPIVALDGEWQNFFAQHKKMRKKIRTLEKIFGNRMSFEVFDATDDWEARLNEYMVLESKSWKAGKVGTSSSIKNRIFHTSLLGSLAAENMFRFGFLYIDQELISAEIAYVMDDKVYFCQGTFDLAFGQYSPGMVSTSLFIKYFYGKGFREGDYLCGYAHYINAWAKEIVQTYELMIHHHSLKVRLVRSIRWLREHVYRHLNQLKHARHLPTPHWSHRAR